jgi:hypothetical protein
MLSIPDRVKAEAQVEAFIEILATRYNIKEEEIPEIIDNLKWIGSHRRGISRVSWTAGLAVISIGISGLGLALWEGIKHMATK